MDRNKITKGDMSLVTKLFKYSTAEKIPFSFMYGERRINGIPGEFAPVVKRELIDSNMVRYTIAGKNPEGLEITAEYTEYLDFPVTEWIVYIANRGEKDTPILSDIKITEGTLEGTNPVLLHGNGDTVREDGYEYFYDNVDKELVIAPDGGLACLEALPYMRLMFKEYGINIAVGWPAQWEVGMKPSENGKGVDFYAKQQRANMVLKPGEKIRTPRMTFMGYEGDETRGRNVWRRWYFKHIIPKENGQPLPPKMILHTWKIDGGPEFCRCSEKNQIEAIETYVSKGLKPDIWWIDAGWYACDMFWQTTGNWYPEPNNWPNTMMPVSKKCEEYGIQFLLWFEPERVLDNTYFGNMKEWVLDCKPEHKHNYKLFDLSNDACCDFLIEYIDDQIKKNGVHLYRQDFNFAPLDTWKYNEAEDRIGFMENKHVQNYLRFWDALIERNPGMWIDSCSSGGRRNDLETMRRAVSLHYTDIGYGNHPIKQKQHREMFEWMPYFRAHTMSWDRDGVYCDWDMQPADKFAFHCAMAPAITELIEYYDNDEMFEVGREMTPIWRRAAELMISGDYYPLTECRKSPEDYYAMQFDDPAEKKGFLQVIRNIQCAEDSFTVMPFAEENETYEFEDMETGEKFTLSGKEFAKGYTVNLPKRTGRIWFYKRG